MPNTRETVRALVSAFNVNNYDFNAVKTNFTLQSEGKKDYIVVSFEKSMDTYQCRRYLDSIKRKIIREFYGIEESNDAEILDTAKLIFDVNSFPFDISDRDWSWDKQHGFKFVTPVDKGVIFNLKSHLAASLAKDVIEDMPTCNIRSSDRKDYLWQGEFDNKGLRQQFEREFLSRMRERYENVPKDPLKVKDNSVYIKDVFDDARFIDSVTRRVAWLIGRDLQADSKNRSDVRAFKDLIMEILDPSTRVVTSAFLCASPLNREESSILIPVILSDRGARFLTAEEAGDINHKFSNLVLDDISDKTQATFKVNGSSAIYGIDFSNKEISHCVITKIIESSVINKDHELAIDPERVLSPAQSPFNSPTHAEPSGLRTPPEQTGDGFKGDRDSGIGESPPKLKDSGAQSSSGGPRSLFEQPQTQEFPTPSRGEELGRSPRRGSEKKQVLHNPVNLAGPSKGFSPSPQLNSIAVSYGVSGPSSLLQSVSAAQNVPAGTSTWSSPASSAGFSSWSPSGASSSKGANPAGTSAWSQPMGHWSLPVFSAQSSDSSIPGPSLWSPSEPSSSKGTNKSGPVWISTRGSYSLPPLPPLISLPVSSGSVLGSRPSTVKLLSWKGASERRTSDKPLTEKEKELFEKLLYAFNLNNYILEYLNTNFIVKNGKIASSIHDSVNVKEYLQELRGYMIKEYCGTEEEAYDLNEFPFEFLPNCEKNQEITVVANISSGALSNLKKLFIQEYEKKVEIGDIDINIVEKAVKSKKDIWVNSQVKRRGEEGGYYERVRPHEAITTCYPDKNKLEYIPIIKEESGYCLDRDYSPEEVESFIERWRRPKGTSVAGKVKPEDNKDSCISSGEVTDAENVSSKAEGKTSGTSGYESMDCENPPTSDQKSTRRGSLKRRSQLPVGEDSPSKSPKRDSLPLSRLESLSLSSSSHQIGKR